MTELLDPTAPPTVSPFDMWLGERDWLFKPVRPDRNRPKTRRALEEWNTFLTHGNLLAHADMLIGETAQAIWQKPDSEHVEIADRVSIGVPSDPVGETVGDERRIRLRTAVDRLIHDRWRSNHWRKLVVDTNTACLAHGVTPISYRPDRTPTSDLGLWRFERNIMLEYCGHAPHRIQALEQFDPKAVRKLADLFARTNQHLEQTVGNVATTFAHYSGDTTT